MEATSTTTGVDSNPEAVRGRIVGHYEVHSLTLYQRPELVVWRKNLANFGAFGFQTLWVYQDMGRAKP